jgi:S-adenosylhomocysteine hydrolase
MADDQRKSAMMEANQPSDFACTGRQSIEGARLDLPVLNVVRGRYEDRQPLAGARIALFCPASLHFAALVAVLADLGASVRWAASEHGEASESVRATVATTGSARLVQPRRQQQSSLDCLHDALDWGDGVTANLIVDKDGNAARLVHWGVAIEDGAAPSPANSEDAAAYEAIRRRSMIRPTSYSTIATGIAGSAEYTALGVERLRQIEGAEGLMFPALDASTGGLSGQAPDRDRVATDKLAALLARLVVAQVELFSNGASYRPGLHRFSDHLKRTLSDCEAAAAAVKLATHGAADELSGSSQHEAVSGQ